ncbi:uncharacterized protein LOC106879270 [Octopus bimaculoides]|uniref:uncharacterized protein LOC106879270 n=1 Tax=Octopus bimaculoides TaxID=37653 RepID=UPI00071D078C|nr:uncharacterized protein LOC106879270 [Octopus bimaculoides]|eukprot:XP_014784252.1 PREDICTED: uncharacterized protein LOC106879270 [Octopus bimaculoides]
MLKKMFSPDYVANSITEFKYEPDEGVTFEAYYRRYEQIFNKECKDWDEDMKTHLILRKLAGEYEHYSNYVLPKKPSDINYRNTIDILCKIFSEKSSFFNTCRKCLNLEKNNEEDYITYASRVNREFVRFKLDELTPDMFKCLIFTQGLTAEKDAKVRTRILVKLEENQVVTLQLSEECERIVKHDIEKIEHKDCSRVKQDVVERKW